MTSHRPNVIFPFSADRANGWFMKRPLIALFAAMTALSAAKAVALTPDEVVQGALLTGWQTESGTYMSALHLRMAPEWKTYWRAPGDGGIPPVFDWGGSDNLGGVTIHWPRPSVFHLNGLQSIGYHDELVLPIEISPADPSRPVALKLHVDMGVCHDICVPASVQVTGALVAPGADDRLIRAALADQPQRAKAAGVGAVSCAVEPIADGLRVTARMAMPAIGPDETVVFEPGRQGVWVAEAVEDRQGAELVAWTEMVPPEGVPFALDRSKMVLTVIGPDAAVEIRGCPAP